MSWKGRYGLVIVAVADHEFRIRYLNYGFPSSASEKRVQRSMGPLSNPAEFFGCQEFILGDSGMVANRHCVIMFQRERGRPNITGRQAYFNMKAAPARVAIEQTFGILKSRFPALRNLAMRLKDKPGQATAHAVILTAAVFHNLLIDNYGRDLLDPAGFDDWHAPRGEAQARRDNGELHDRFERRERLIDEMLALEDKAIDVSACVLWYAFLYTSDNLSLASLMASSQVIPGIIPINTFVCSLSSLCSANFNFLRLSSTCRSCSSSIRSWYAFSLSSVACTNAIRPSVSPRDEAPFLLPPLRARHASVSLYIPRVLRRRAWDSPCSDSLIEAVPDRETDIEGDLEMWRAFESFVAPDSDPM